MKGGTPRMIPNSNTTTSFIVPATATTRDQLFVHDASAIILTCMDFRDIDDLVYMANNLGLNNNYDHFILAGASFGLLDKNDTWNNSANESTVVSSSSLTPSSSLPPSSLIPSLTSILNTTDETILQNAFYIHVILAVVLHKIQKIIIIDHMDCGACLTILASLLSQDKTTITAEDEYNYHIQSLRYFLTNKNNLLGKIADVVKDNEIKGKIKALNIECYITDLNDKYIQVKIN
jgi:hypothetical protein